MLIFLPSAPPLKEIGGELTGKPIVLYGAALSERGYNPPRRPERDLLYARPAGLLKSSVSGNSGCGASGGGS